MTADTVGAEKIEALPQTTFQIIPVKGLPFVAVWLVGLVVAIAANKLWALDFFHVVGGAGWTVIDLFLGFILGPIMGRLSLSSRIDFVTKLMPKMILLVPTLVISTLVAGLQLARREHYLLSSYSYHGWVVASIIVVGVMTIIAIGLLEPANLAVLFELKKPKPNGEIVAKLMRRFIYTAAITGAMQVATLVIMTRLAT
ncbi:MAG: hypothetical protein M1483_04590 [Actinobacteria bacterium]|jgi:hypothetical protein|nr:hypothetical protein [Actinomycetota bacterium]